MESFRSHKITPTSTKSTPPMRHAPPHSSGMSQLAPPWPSPSTRSLREGHMHRKPHSSMGDLSSTHGCRVLTSSGHWSMRSAAGLTCLLRKRSSTTAALHSTSLARSCPTQAVLHQPSLRVSMSLSLEVRPSQGPSQSRHCACKCQVHLQSQQSKI